MKRITRITIRGAMRASLSLALVVAAATTSGCHDSSGSGATAFAPLVNDLITNQTSETGAPVTVEGKTFAFPADAGAFAGVLPPDDGSVVD